jgi:hypothetical protein
VLPVFATVGRFEDSAKIRRQRTSSGGDIDDVRLSRVHNDRA